MCSLFHQGHTFDLKLAELRRAHDLALCALLLRKRAAGVAIDFEFTSEKVVPGAGLEPARLYRQGILSP